jgi:phosphoribosyl 1,2-cyclic phosphate phosphodiesterase
VSVALTLLGCGSSGGVPRVAQGWGACDPTNPRNNRRRCSALLEKSGADGRTLVLIDTSPDLRWQLIDAGVAHLDGVLISHPHADHMHGIDDLRPLAIVMRKRIEIYMDEITSAELRAKFSYIFASPPGSSYPPIGREHRLTAGAVCGISGAGGLIGATPFELEHGDISALGFRIGALAYTPDLNGIPDASLPFLEGLDVWIVDALRYAPHPSHFSLDEALSWIERMRPRRAILTNLHTDLDYEALRRRLPNNVEPAYDGMRVEVLSG